MGNKIVITIGLWLFSLLIMSGQGIPIQLMVVDDDGFEKVNHDVKLRLTMSNDTSSTAGQYQEVHITQSNEFGIVSVEMGSGISTTNSQVLGISQFAFSVAEPFIKVELDTSQSLSQYYEVGYVPYSYPMISRRALRADSAIFSDSASFVLNEKNEWYSDSSETNELQSLEFNPLSQVLSLTNGNSVEITSKNEYFGELGELLTLNIPDSISFSSYWVFSVASNTHFYGWINDTLLLKAPIESPWMIDTLISSYQIHNVYPNDSLILGVSSDGLKIIKSDLNFGNLDSITLGGTFPSIDLAYKSNVVSAYVATSTSSSSTKYLKLWDLTTGTMQSNSLGYGVYYQMTPVGGFRFYNNNVYLLNRFTGSIERNINVGTNSTYYFQFDTTFSCLVGRFGSYSSYGNSVSIKDTLGNTNGSINFGGGTNVTDLSYGTRFNLDGVKLYKVQKNESGYYDDYTSYSYIILINPNNANQGYSISSLYLKNFDRAHPESSTGFYVIRGYSEYILIFNNCKNAFIDGKFVSGSFIYKIPY